MQSNIPNPALPQRWFLAAGIAALVVASALIMVLMGHMQDVAPSSPLPHTRQQSTKETQSAREFIVPPPTLTLAHLSQHQLNGALIGTNLRTAEGARLSADIHYPKAALDVEVKPSGIAFDGRNIRSAAVTDAVTTTVTFTGKDGAYHWRARARASDGAETEWQAFAPTQRADFLVFHEPQASSSNKEQDQPAGPASMALASGGGSHEPLPSIIAPSPSLWSMLISPMRVYIAASFVAMMGVWLMLQRFASRKNRRGK